MVCIVHMNTFGSTYLEHMSPDIQKTTTFDFGEELQCPTCLVSVTFLEKCPSGCLKTGHSFVTDSGQILR